MAQKKKGEKGRGRQPSCVASVSFPFDLHPFCSGGVVECVEAGGYLGVCCSPNLCFLPGKRWRSLGGVCDAVEVILRLLLQLTPSCASLSVCVGKRRRARERGGRLGTWAPTRRTLMYHGTQIYTAHQETTHTSCSFPPPGKAGLPSHTFSKSAMFQQRYPGPGLARHRPYLLLTFSAQGQGRAPWVPWAPPLVQFALHPV